MAQQHALRPRHAVRAASAAVLCGVALGCSPALETPPLAPDATPAAGGAAGNDADAGPSADAPDASDSPPGLRADGGWAQRHDAGACTEGDVASCSCPGMHDDGSPISGLQVCVESAFTACRCTDPDGGPPDLGIPSCGADAYVGTLSGTLSFAGLTTPVQPRTIVTALELTLLPIASDGRRAVSGELHATVGGLADLDGELHGHLSCANPPALSATATAGFTWLGTLYTLTGEFTANLEAAAFPSGEWFLETDGGAQPSASGQGRWSASPR